MFAAPLLLCLTSMPPKAPALGDPVSVRDLAPLERLDASVRSLPLATARTVASVAKGLAALAATPEERARAAYVWTTAHVAYSLDRRDAAHAMVDLTGDCDAHAAVFAGLCRAMGLECETVTGRVRFAVPPGADLAADSKPLAPGQWLVSHAWNAVRIDGRWGLVDTTMGTKSAKDAVADDYFLADPAVVTTDHVPDDPRWAFGASPTDLARAPIVRPIAWRMGIDRKNLEIRDGHLSLPWRKGLRAAYQTEAGSVPDRALAQPAADGTELRLRPTGGASVVWLGLSVEGVWRPLAGYAVSGPAARTLPKVMKDFYDTGATLAGPFERDLAAGKTAEIRLRAPGASSVVAFQGPSLAGRFRRDGDDWVLQTEPAPGAELEVMASYADPRQFQALVTYDVR